MSPNLTLSVLPAQNTALYVRTSTEDQKNSINNQLNTLRAYASQQGLSVVKIFVDNGKSGLSSKNREGLKNLIAEVQNGNTRYGTILVMDISRWGRFQNIDESAHYEYICQSVGVKVIYVMEVFTNDGSFASSLQKSLKRIMAAEYSRELSAKISETRHNLGKKGYFLGGKPGHGLRRAILDQHGKIKKILDHYEKKSGQSDRVILVLGPKKEQKTVLWIFKHFVENDWGEQQICNSLNEKNAKTTYGTQWTKDIVRWILRSGRYIGCAVVNKTSLKLGGPSIDNPQKEWIRVYDHFPAIIPLALFNAAQKKIERRASRQTDIEIFCNLRKLLKQEGRLTQSIINLSGITPTYSSLRDRFKSITNLYKLIDYQRQTAIPHGTRKHTNKILGAVRHELAQKLQQKEIASSSTLMGRIWFLTVTERLRISFVICRYFQPLYLSGAPRWTGSMGSRKQLSELIVVMFMDKHNHKVRDYYLVPTKTITFKSLSFGPLNISRVQQFRLRNMDQLFMTVLNTHIRKRCSHEICSSEV